MKRSPFYFLGKCVVCIKSLLKIMVDNPAPEVLVARKLVDDIERYVVEYLESGADDLHEFTDKMGF